MADNFAARAGADRTLARKRALLRLAGTLGLSALLEAVFPDNRRLEVTRHSLAAPLPRRLTIAHLADLHVRHIGPRERALLEALRSAAPDLVVITGDLFACTGDPDAVWDLLASLAAPLGVWAVPGNWDYGCGPEGWADRLRALNVRLLVNEAAELAPGVWIAGLDDAAEGTPDAAAALRGVPKEAYVIALHHCPSSFDAVAGRVGLALAGHTHGGQARIPGLPPLWLPRGSGRYVEGWYERAGSRMYVSRGIGDPGLPLRLFCRPELALIELRPEAGVSG